MLFRSFYIKSGRNSTIRKILFCCRDDKVEEVLKKAFGDVEKTKDGYMILGKIKFKKINPTLYEFCYPKSLESILGIALSSLMFSIFLANTILSPFPSISTIIFIIFLILIKLFLDHFKEKFGSDKKLEFVKKFIDKTIYSFLPTMLIFLYVYSKYPDMSNLAYLSQHWFVYFSILLAVIFAFFIFFGKIEENELGTFPEEEKYFNYVLKKLKNVNVDWVDIYLNPINIYEEFYIETPKPLDSKAIEYLKDKYKFVSIKKTNFDFSSDRFYYLVKQTSNKKVVYFLFTVFYLIAYLFFSCLFIPLFLIFTNHVIQTLNLSSYLNIISFPIFLFSILLIIILGFYGYIKFKKVIQNDEDITNNKELLEDLEKLVKT